MREIVAIMVFLIATAITIGMVICALAVGYFFLLLLVSIF